MLTTPCPDPAVLERFLDEGLETDRAEVAREHVRHCPGCQAALDERTDRAGLRGWRRTVALRAPDGPALQRGLRALADTPLPAAPLPPLAPAEALGPYRVLGELGRGGMGIVYRAHDPALDRAVAVKVLRPDLATDEAARARFVREAQATARLRHDHVVRVYAVADPPGGQPYLVMECLEGPTLAGLLRQERRLDPRRAAAVAAEAADGLAAAHAAGLVHRDVKPANVMFDGGRAKVMDFGLARLASGPSGLTEEGALAGTPAYMSPEQARGDERLDGRADVYGLGATLYEMLTGELPFRGAPHMVLRQVLEEEPRPVRALNDAVPRDLETVGLKALAKEPHRRYATAAEFAADLRRFLNGEPVKARPVGRLGRARRWCRRNPWIAGLSAALLAAVAAGFAGVTWQWLRAEGEAAEASRQRLQAERGFRKAREAVDRFLRDVGERRLFLAPGLQPLQRKLLEQALAYYQDFLREWGDAPGVRQELAAAHTRLGSIQLHLGDRGAARRSYEQARPLQEELLRSDPDGVASRENLARTCQALAALDQESGRLAEALAGCRRGLELLEPFARGHRDTELPIILAATYGTRSLVHETAGRLDEALADAHKAVDLLEELARAAPREWSLRQDLATMYNRVGNLHRQAARAEEARRWLAKARDVGERQAAAYPGLYHWQPELATTYQRLGELLQNDGRGAEALALHEKARALREGLARANPEVSAFQRDLADGWGAVGRAQALLGRLAESREALGRALALWEKLAADAPAVPDLGIALASCLANLALVQGESGRAAEALRTCRRALSLCERLRREHPADPEARYVLAAAWNNLAQLAPAEEALPALARAGDMLDELGRGRPAVPRHQALVAVNRLNTGKLQRLRGRTAEALRSLEQAHALYAPLTAAHPKAPEYRHGLALTCLELGTLHDRSGDAPGARAEALRWYERARDLGAALACDHPEVAAYRHELARVQNNLGVLHRRGGRPGEALRCHDEAAALCADLVAGRPDVRAYRGELAWGHTLVAEALSAAGQRDAALARLEHGYALVADLLRSDPNDATARWTGWQNRSLQGLILHGRGRREEAGAAFQQALTHATRLYEQDPRDPEHRRKLSKSLLWLAGIHWEEGRHAATAELARERLRLWPDDPAEVYVAARQLALCMRQASRGKGKAWRTADEQARRNLYAAETLAALRQAVRHGFRDRAALLSAPELALLRGRADFKQLVAELTPPGK